MTEMPNSVHNSDHTANKSQVMSWQYRWVGRFFNFLGLIIPSYAEKLLLKLWLTPIKVKQSGRTRAFWNSAEDHFEFEAAGLKHRASVWGSNNNLGTVVVMHGWRGSGYQFKQWLEPLLSNNLKVVMFDAPAHGHHLEMHPGKRQTHVLEFSESLLAIEKHLGGIDSVVSHSLGGLVVVDAIHRGLTLKHCVMVAPNLDLCSLFTRFCYQLNLSAKVTRHFEAHLNEFLTELFQFEDYWNRYSLAESVRSLPNSGMFVYDLDDEENILSEMISMAKLWEGASHIETKGLGHFKILKDDDVIKVSVSGIAEALA